MIRVQSDSRYRPIRSKHEINPQPYHSAIKFAENNNTAPMIWYASMMGSLYRRRNENPAVSNGAVSRSGRGAGR
jgi:hypothetical protein